MLIYGAVGGRTGLLPSGRSLTCSSMVLEVGGDGYYLMEYLSHVHLWCCVAFLDHLYKAVLRKFLEYHLCKALLRIVFLSLSIVLEIFLFY